MPAIPKEAVFLFTTHIISGKDKGRTWQKTLTLPTDEMGKPIIEEPMRFLPEDEVTPEPEPFAHLSDEEKSAQGIIPMGKDPA